MTLTDFEGLKHRSPPWRRNSRQPPFEFKVAVSQTFTSWYDTQPHIFGTVAVVT
jgi:hypothetical protein